MTSQEELREKIIEIRRRLEGRKNTHVQVSKHSGWTNLELSNVLEEDEWLYEKEMLALIEAHTAKAVEEAEYLDFDDGYNEAYSKLLYHFANSKRKTIKSTELNGILGIYPREVLSIPKSNGNLVKGMK